MRGVLRPPARRGLASPGGAVPTVVDEGSLAPEAIGEEESAKQRKGATTLAATGSSSTLVLADVDLDSYDAVFVPGGHGPMEDLAVSDDLGRILVTMLDGGKVVSSVCHGPAGLLPARRADGSWLFAGRNLTAFTDAEEEQAGPRRQGALAAGVPPARGRRDLLLGRFMGAVRGRRRQAGDRPEPGVQHRGRAEGRRTAHVLITPVRPPCHARPAGRSSSFPAERVTHPERGKRRRRRSSRLGR